MRGNVYEKGHLKPLCTAWGTVLFFFYLSVEELMNTKKHQL